MVNIIRVIDISSLYQTTQGFATALEIWISLALAEMIVLQTKRREKELADE